MEVMMNSRFLVAAALVAGGCASAQYSRPYVLFAGEHNLRLQGIVATDIVSIDGERIPGGAQPPFPPGKRTVEVSVPQTAGQTAPIMNTITVDAQPCMRYYIGARNATATSFEAVVTTTEPIKECQRTSASAY
jgi:hypothetical protein